MKWLLIAVALAAAVTNAASAGPKLEAKLSADVDKQGRVTATLEVTNSGDRPICFLAHEMLVILEGSDGKGLGDIAIVDFLQPDSVDVIWDGGYPQTFDLSINGGHNVNGETVLAPDEVRRFAKATTYLSAFDCIDFLANKGNAKPRIKRVLNATPTFDP